MLKVCAKCGKIHDFNYICKKQNRINNNFQKSVDKENEFRQTSKWKKKSLQIRNEAQGLCEVCRSKKEFSYGRIEVHHIIKLRENIDLGLDDDNLIALCSYHHKQADNGELSIDYLKSLVEERKKRLGGYFL